MWSIKPLFISPTPLAMMKKSTRHAQVNSIAQLPNLVKKKIAKKVEEDEKLGASLLL